MSSQDEKSRLEVWKSWRRRSGEEESPDELSGWDALIKARKAWRRRSEEEETPDELRERWRAWTRRQEVIDEEERARLRAYLERVERTPVEIPAELREEIRSVVERDKQARDEMMERIAERRFTPLDIGALVERQHELIDSLPGLGERVISQWEEGDRARDRKEDRRHKQVLLVSILGLVLTTGLAIVGWAIALGIIQWSPSG